MSLFSFSLFSINQYVICETIYKVFITTALQIWLCKILNYAGNLYKYFDKKKKINNLKCYICWWQLAYRLLLSFGGEILNVTKQVGPIKTISASLQYIFFKIGKKTQKIRTLNLKQINLSRVFKIINIHLNLHESKFLQNVLLELTFGLHY